jgi:hypothetical protein
MRRTVIAISLLLPSLALADSSYNLKIDAPPAKKAQKGVVRIEIQPGTGYHVNKDYPASVTLTDVPAGIQVEKPKQTAKDAVKLAEGGAEFDISYTAANPGKQTLVGELKFAVCSANSCDPKKEKLNLTLDVK